MPSSRQSSQPRDLTHISYICLLHWQAGSLPQAPYTVWEMLPLYKQIFWVCVFWFKRMQFPCNMQFSTDWDPALRFHLCSQGSSCHVQWFRQAWQIFHLSFGFLSIVLTEWFPLFYLPDHLFILLHYSFFYLLSLDQLSSWQMNFYFFAPLYSF